MKVDIIPHHSSHETIMDRKPPLDERAEQNIYHQHQHGSHGTPHSPLLDVTPEGYYARQPDHVSPAGSSASWGGPQYSMQQHHHHQQQQRQLAPPPYYTQSYLNQMHHAHHYHPAAHHYPSHSWHPAAGGVPMLPSMAGPYYGGLPSPPGGPPPPSVPHYASLDSSRGGASISRSHSSETFGSASAKGRRQSGGRRSRRGSRQGGGGAGSPPNRAWYRYDANTTCLQMRGRIVEIAKDRDGSKFVQRRLQVADLTEMQLVFDEAVNDIEEIWDDVYGNYILQGLLELGTDDMRDWIGKRIVGSGDAVTLSTKVYGCRLVQKALDTLDRENVANMVASIKGKVWLLVHDHNGNHVIQKCITRINEFVQSTPNQEDDPLNENLLKSLDIIIEEVVTNIKDLAIHPYGCRVVQRLIEHCSGAQKDKVLDGIGDEGLFGSLIDHEYGNYVIQRVLAYGRTADKAIVFETVTSNNNVLKLSKQKHSSNVVEMLLSYGNTSQRHQIVEEILNCFCVDQNYVQKSAVVSMAEDSYANYVLKTALDVLEEGPLRQRLFDMLLSSLEDLEQSQYAKQIVLRVKAFAQQAQESNCE